jgi:putative ABC transport system permease protein
MRTLREWWHRLIGQLRRGRRDEDLAEELQLHAELASAAGRRVDRPAQAIEALRDQRGLPWLDDLERDLRYGLRSLRRTPGVTFVALVILALGIGATTAVFTVVRSVLLRPLPFADPGALYVISYTSPGPAWLYPGMSDRGYLAFREATQTFESMATFAEAQSTLTGIGDAMRVSGAAVTTDFFRVLGIRAAAGRIFGPEQDRPGNDRSVLISDRLWRGTFGGDPQLLEKTITLNGMPYRVIGILPPGFSYPAGATYWIPLTVRVNPNLGFTRPVIGRVNPGVTVEQAQADLDRWVRSLPPDPRRGRDLLARVMPLHEAMVGDIRLSLLVFAAAVGLVLLIACANVANLLLLRAMSRRQEIATRLALGGSRRRVARQLITEGALMSLAGGCLGTAVALAAGPALLSLLPSGRLPADLAVRADGWVLAFAVAASLLTGLVGGLAPMAQVSGGDLYSTLRAGVGSATRRSHSLRQALVVVEVALTLVLLVAAGLLLRSFLELRSVPLGFSAERVMTMTVDLPVTRYPTAEQATLLHARLLQSLADLPGVRTAAAVNWLPLGELFITGDVQAEDRPELAGRYYATKVGVSPRYFETIGIRLVRGRPFADADRSGASPVGIVSESVARSFWPGGDPLGKRIALVERPRPEDWLTVVGVVEDVRQSPFSLDLAHAVYQPYPQVTNRGWVGYMTFLVRTDDDPARLAPMMRAALARLDPNEAPQSVAALETIVDRTVADPQFRARLVGAFSLAGLLLAAIGLYGVLAAAIVERRREIGVRMALGADRRSIIRMIVRQTTALAAVGIAIGLAGSVAATGVLSALLFNVTPTDAPTFAIAVAVLLAGALTAAIVPARRASRLDPNLVLRAE